MKEDLILLSKCIGTIAAAYATIYALAIFIAITH